MSTIRTIPALLLAAALLTTLAAAEPTSDELARLAVARCAATAGQRPTPQEIIAKVDEAAALVEREGAAAFPAFRGDSRFIFAGTYLWIHDLDSVVMYVHPIKPKMEGKSQASMVDMTGKLLFIEMNRIVSGPSGAGWVDYVWPKPGQREGSPKVSYVKVARHGGVAYVIGCGVYDMTLDEIRASGAH